MQTQPKKKPQVALESTIVALGLPYPRNVEVGWKLARAVKASGAEPRTMAIIDGMIKVGLSDDELERIAAGKNVQKLAASDLGPALALGGTGATTVSATCALAYGAGIQVFATGGIGGVHREVVETFDESQDLWALSKYPVAVVCAGAKAILDLPRTMERLESLGVPVVGFGTDELPAFYTRSSGIKLSHRVDTIEELARVVHFHFNLHPGSGILIANPIAAEHALDANFIQNAIDRALVEAREKSISGKALTPWLLARLEGLTEGKSIEANVALAESNARLAGELSVRLAALQEVET